MHIVDMVYFWARTIPLRPAIIEPEGVVTYAGLAHGVEVAAEHFAHTIAERSKPVAVSLPTGTKTVVAVLALLRAGFDVVLAHKAVLGHLSATGANTLVADREGDRLSPGTNVMFSNAWVTFGTSPAKLDKPISQPKVKGGNIICFTSGTTGRPKFVTCPQASWQCRLLFPLNSAYSDYERMLIFPRLTTSWGLSRAYEALHSGRTICLAPNEQAMLWLVNTYEVDTILASPQQALTLAEIQEKITKYALPSLKTVQLGGSLISQDGIRRVQQSLCRNIIIIYGSTEAGVTALAPYDRIAQVPGAVGFVMPGVDVEIVDASDRVLPVGSEGFLRVRSPVLAQNEIAGKGKIPWFYPGDLGHLTEQGMLCIAGRATDVLNRGGEKLSIGDFENFLMTCPGVKDAGICTLMGQTGFEEAWVGVVLDPAVDLSALRQEIELSAQFGRSIDRLFVVDSIPRGVLGKIQREELKAMLHAIGEEGSLSDHCVNDCVKVDVELPD